MKKTIAEMIFIAFMIYGFGGFLWVSKHKAQD